MRTELLCISVLRVASGSRVKFASCKSALNPLVVYSTDRSKAVVPVLVLLFVVLCCSVVYSSRRFVLSLALCYFFFLFFFSPFSIAITSLAEGRANRSAFRTFVRFALVWFCLFPLPLGVGKGCGLCYFVLVFLVFLVLRLPRLGKR